MSAFNLENGCNTYIKLLDEKSWTLTIQTEELENCVNAPIVLLPCLGFGYIVKWFYCEIHCEYKKSL